MDFIKRAGAMLALVLLAACGSSSPVAGSGGGDGGGSGGGSSGGSSSGGTAPKYDVTVTRTTYGIPHIKANDFGSLGYGYGYTFAEDNLCVMMDDYLTTRGQRSQYLGGTGTYSIPAVPVTALNVDSDYFWKLIASDDNVAKFKAAAAPDVQLAVTGYIAGFNRYMNELKAGQHPGRHATCASAAWLTNLTEADEYRRFIRLAVIASSSALTTEIATAQPPALGLPPSANALPAELKARRKALAHIHAADLPFEKLKQKKFGSNMYALGPQATQDGSTMVLGNPHFPWTGTERLYISQLTVPGKMDIEGSSLYGVPVINIGFNDHFAWSHTVSTAYRFTLYQLIINPLKPTQYLYNGGFVDMTAVPLSIQVLMPDGTTQTQTRTLYKSQYGPMVSISADGLPILGWSNLLGYTMRDANLENVRLINQFYSWNKAQSFDEFKQLHKTILGVPWVNTVASGPGGDAYYGDISVVPNVSDAKVAACSAQPLALLLSQLEPGLPLLDGSRADCAWDTDADAPAPGIFGPSHLPVLERQDFVANMNDSYWLTNPAQPLTGFARIIGAENSERTLRTRLGILQAQRRIAGTDGRDGKGFTLQQLQDVDLAANVYGGELALSDVKAKLCPKAGSADTTAICGALAQWDGTANLASIGFPEWQEFWRNVAGISGSVWKVPFSASDPVNTPNTLDTGNSSVQQALANAQATVQNAGIDFNAKLGDVQQSGVNTAAGGARIPIFGGEGDPMGIFTTAYSNGLTKNGYDIDFGNSYIHTVTWDSGGVHAEGFITYSESSDPANPHYSDYTQAYSQKKWLRLPFHDDEIQAAKESELHLTGP